MVRLARVESPCAQRGECGVGYYSWQRGRFLGRCVGGVWCIIGRLGGVHIMCWCVCLGVGETFFEHGV